MTAHSHRAHSVTLFSIFWKFLLAITLIAHLLAFTGCGTTVGSPSVILPQFSSSNLTFPGVAINTASQAVQVSLTNSGKESIDIQSISVPAPFALAQNECGSTLMGGYTCNISVAFLPIQPGTFNGQIVVQTAQGNSSLPVAGTGTATLQISSAQSYIRVGQTLQLSASMNGQPTQNVTWSVDPTSATISASGLLTVSPNLPAPSSVAVTASSAQFSSSVGTLSIPVWSALPNLTAASPAVLPLGTTTIVTLTGSDFNSVCSILVNGVATPFNIVSPNALTLSIATTPWQQGAVSIVAQENGSEGGFSDPLALGLNVPAVSFDTAVRFLEQAGFGANLAAIQQVQQLGLSGWIATQLQARPYDYTSGAGAHLGQWYRNTQNPATALRQRVSMALSHIYLTGSNATCYWMQCSPLWESVIEGDAFGNARQLLNDVSVSQIMGAFLDNADNYGGGNALPNQNFAREIMQLMTIGPDQLNADGSSVVDINGQPVPAYTQDNIEAMSAALSGWQYPSTQGFSTSNWAPPLVLVESWHAQGSKTILSGVTLPAGQGGTADLNQVLDTLFQHQNFGPFLTRRLIQALVKSNPSPSYISRISAVFADDGTGVRGNLGAVVEAILLDPEARGGDDPSTLDQSAGKLLEPDLYLSFVMNTSATVFTDDQVSNADSSMGQQHWNEPTVFSDFDPNHVLSDGTPAPEAQLLSSSNLTAAMVVVYGTLHQGWPGFSTQWSSSPFWNCSSVAELIDRINHYVFHGTMTTTDQNTLTTYAGSQQWSTVNDLVPDLTFLAFSSTGYKVIR